MKATRARVIPAGDAYDSNQYLPSQQRHPKKAIILSFIELDYRDPSF
jgi:hypothetical protein